MVTLILSIVSILLLIISNYLIFEKANKKGWYSLIPVYNILVLMDIAGLKRWMIFLLLIPFVNIIIYALIYEKIAENFSRGGGFAIGILLLPQVFLPILAFGKSKYVSHSVVSFKSGLSSLLSAFVMLECIVLGVLIYTYIFGDVANFTSEGEPVPLVDGESSVPHYLGTVYKGGFIVPILVAINLIIILFSIERFITLSIAKGKGRAHMFVSRIKNMLENKQIESAIEACNEQKGSLANVVRSGLIKYNNIQHDSDTNKEQKLESLKKELEEATALELPMLSKNLVILSTCASIATLIGLIGTVLGMIRSFAAMSGGAPDTSELATGISEALINTFFGIAGSTIAIIMYNFFSTKIDAMTYSIDEASFTIVQDFSASQK